MDFKTLVQLLLNIYLLNTVTSCCWSKLNGVEDFLLSSEEASIVLLSRAGVLISMFLLKLSLFSILFGILMFDSVFRCSMFGRLIILTYSSSSSKVQTFKQRLEFLHRTLRGVSNMYWNSATSLKYINKF